MLRFHRAFSPGLQEYIEAVALLEFIETGKLITLEKVEQDIQKGNSKVNKSHIL